MRSVEIVTCPNPSPMTLEGTNTYVLGAPDSGEVIVVDPGPADYPEHLEAVARVVNGRQVAGIVITHRHRDHTGAAASFAQAFTTTVRGYDPAQCLDSPLGVSAEPLADAEVIAVGDLSVTVLHTPGHTSDSVCLWVERERVMLTGDTILGRGTTMLDFPDGTLTDYLGSLERLASYTDAQLLPAHGPSGGSLAQTARTYARHRQQRLDQAAELLATHGDLSAEKLGELIYGRDAPLNPAVITKIAAAQLDHLQRAPR